MSSSPPVVVVVPARDEEDRIAACLHALAGQQGTDGALREVIVVLDGCRDRTAERARRAAAATGLPLRLLSGPERGVGFARKAGMDEAARRLRAAEAQDGLIASTDADSVVAPGWLAAILAAVADGAAAVGGPISLEPIEAAALPREVLDARRAEAVERLRAVRRHTAGAEHHQFSGASLAITLAAHDRVGGLPAVAQLEDEALERALRTAGLPVAYVSGAAVRTSARTTGHTARGLAQVLRTQSWRARQGVRPGAASAGVPLATVLRPATGGRGLELHAALEETDEQLVLVLGPGVDVIAAEPLLTVLAEEPERRLVIAAEPDPDPLEGLVVRPALNLHLPELAVLTSPLSRTWAARRSALASLRLPHGDIVDLAVLLDVFLAHGLSAVAERPVATPLAPPPNDPSLRAYELLTLITDRAGLAVPRSSAYTEPGGTRRAQLEESPPLGERVGAGGAR